MMDDMTNDILNKIAAFADSLYGGSNDPRDQAISQIVSFVEGLSGADEGGILIVQHQQKQISALREALEQAGDYLANGDLGDLHIRDGVLADVNAALNSAVSP